MPITVSCPCGKKLQVDEQHRGKKVKCPACGNVLVAEEARELATAVQAEAPVPPVAPIVTEETPRPPVQRRADAQAKRSLLPWIAGGGCAFLAVFSCCICGSVGTWYFGFYTPEAADLRFVHADVNGFVAIRVADIKKADAVKDQLKLLPLEDKKVMDEKLADVEKKFGMSVDDLERVTFIFRSSAANDVGIVFRTTKPMDRDRIIAAIGQGKQEKSHGDKKYFVIDRMALHFASDRIVLTARTEIALKDFLDHAGKSPRNPALARGIKLAASGKHAAVIAFALNRTIMNDFLRFKQNMANLAPMNGLIMTATLDKQLAVEAHGVFATSEEAGRAKSDFETFRRAEIDRMKFRPMNPDHEEWMMHNVLESMAIEQRGAEIVLKGKSDVGLKPFAPIFREIRIGGAGLMQSQNNLKWMMLGMHSYHDANKSLPRAAMPAPGDFNGPGLLSWRVAILPYVDEAALYNQIHLNEPWDSAHNRRFANKMPKVYQLPGKPNDGKTYYQVFQGDETAFQSRFPMRLTGITDGTSNTIGIVEAANPVDWMKPADIPFRLNEPDLIKQVGNHWGDNSFQAAMCDGMVRHFRRAMPRATLDALITRNGNESVLVEDWEVGGRPQPRKQQQPPPWPRKDGGKK